MMPNPFVDLSTKFIATAEPKAVDGEYYDLPGQIVYTSYALKLPEKGRIEVNVISPEAPASFEWQLEYTVNDKRDGTFVHLLVLRDGNLAETYGKTVLDVDKARAAEIQDLVERLLAETTAP